MANTYLDELRSKSQSRLSRLQENLSSAAEILGQDGTIYTTGSYGRLEAGAESDIDVFIVSHIKEGEGDEPRSPLMTEVRQIRLKSELIQAVENAGMADFDAGGKFLKTHLYSDIVEETGSPADDFKNTFTGRMLLILESRSVLGGDVYSDLKRDCINAYFRDFASNEADFVPYFLVNDILRMWRTFCVNYEYYRADSSDWRVKNLKLKYSRMLTCFSAIIYLLAVYRINETVTPTDVDRMIGFTPIERLEQFTDEGDFAHIAKGPEIHRTAADIIEDYGEFLEFVQVKKRAIRALKKDEDEWRQKSHEFGARIAGLLKSICGDAGLDNRLYRSILV